MDAKIYFPQINNSSKQIIKWIVSLLVTGIFVYLCVVLIDWRRVISLLEKANWLYVTLSVIISLISSVFIALRLQLLFAIIGKITLLRVWLISQVATSISSVVPLFAGVASAMVMFKRELKTTTLKVFVIILLDYLLTLALTLVLSLIAMMYFGYQGVFWSQEGKIVLGLTGCLVFILFLYAKAKMPQAYVEKMYSLFTKNKRRFFGAFFYTFIIHFFVFLQTYLIFLSFGITVPIIQFILGISFFSLLNIISLTPLRIGQYEALGVITLPLLLEIDSSQVFVALFVNHALSLIISAIVGYISFLILLKANGK